jgi:hypothetical protein
MKNINVHVNVSGVFVGLTGAKSLWVDPNQGKTVDFRLSDNEVLDLATCSPWRDEKGLSQAIGVWKQYEGPSGPMADVGLGRVSYPEGQVIDIVKTEKLPTSTPCWFPGTSAKVLYAAGDGQLYQCAFEPAEKLKSTKATANGFKATPEPLRWDCTMPGVGDVVMSEPHWLDDSQAPGVLLVSLRVQEEVAGSRFPQYSRSQIWWLRLNQNGSTIQAAGRVLADDIVNDERDERCPSVGRNAAGELTLAYHRRERDGTWTLHLAGLNLDRASGVPIQLDNAGKLLVTQCQPVAAAFSRDGRWISFVHNADVRLARVKRISVSGDENLLTYQVADTPMTR